MIQIILGTFQLLAPSELAFIFLFILYSIGRIQDMQKNIANLSKRKKIALLLLVVFILVVFESLLLMLRFNRINKYKPEIIGVSFSQIQAERYGSDWRANYIAILDDLNFKQLRIPAYWNRIEVSKGNYDFTELDWMVNEAGKRNANVTILVGQKSIRYPECFYPEWVDKTNTSKTSQDAVDMIKAVVQRYKNNKTVTAWQLENEFVLKSFGECPANMLNGKQLKKELEALREIDSSRPVLISQSDQYGFPVQGPLADTIGFSMYKWSWKKEIGYYKYPQDGTFFWWKAGILSALRDQNLKIHELQAEAWGPVGNENLDYSESMRSMNPRQFEENINYARQTKIREFDLWGAEWWWHLKQQGKNEMWYAVKKIVNN